MSTRAPAGSIGNELRLCRVFATRACGNLSVRPTRVRRATSCASSVVECPSKCEGDSSACRPVEMELQLFAWKRQQSEGCEADATKKLAPLGGSTGDDDVVWSRGPSAPALDESVWEGSAPEMEKASVDASAPELTPRTWWTCHCFCTEPSAPEWDLEEADV